MTFHYESDGGGWGKVSQPKTHYVTDDLETRIDCDTASQARRLAKELNDATPEKREALLHSLR
jgi:hypothetical protein